MIFPLSLRGRLTLLYGGLMMLTVSLAFFGGYGFVKHQTIRHLDQALDLEFKEIKDVLSDLKIPFDPSELQEVMNLYTDRKGPHFYYQIHTDRDGVIFKSRNLGNRFLPDLSSGVLQTPEMHVNLGSIRAGESLYQNLHMQVATPLQAFQDLEERFHWMMFWGIPLILLWSLGLGYLFSSFTLQPLKVIQMTAQEISGKHLKKRIPLPQSRDELFELAVLLNDMFDRLEKSFSQLQRFTSDTAHELRTPLSVIRLHAERLLTLPNLPAEARQELEEQSFEILRLNEVIECLLLLAKAEGKHLVLKRESRKVSEFMDDLKEDVGALAEEKDLKVEWIISGDGLVRFDGLWIRQVILNLISNALKFSPFHGTIKICSEWTPREWCVLVLDEGPGVPEERLTSIFDRFFQVRSEMDSLRTGSGLGLAISKSLVELHEGSMECRNRDPGKGFEIGFRIPLSEQG